MEVEQKSTEACSRTRVAMDIRMDAEAEDESNEATDNESIA